MVLYGHDISVGILPLVREVPLCFSCAFFLNCSQLSEILDRYGKYDIPRKYDMSVWLRATEAGVFRGTCKLHVWHNSSLSGNTAMAVEPWLETQFFFNNFHSFFL